jgi:uncharacterized protein (TIGR02284 family)
MICEVVRNPEAKEGPMTRNKETADLNDLIEVLNDGKSFYEEAANKVKSDLASVFQRMARTKGAIAADLSGKVASRGGKPASGGTLSGTMRKLYAEARTSVAGDREAEFVKQLEEFEDRILEAFRESVEHSDDAGVREIALRYLPEVTRDHNDMRALKKIQQASA